MVGVLQALQRDDDTWVTVVDYTSGPYVSHFHGKQRITTNKPNT